jgi:hypothetical protein
MDVLSWMVRRLPYLLEIIEQEMDLKSQGMLDRSQQAGCWMLAPGAADLHVICEYKYIGLRILLLCKKKNTRDVKICTDPTPNKEHKVAFCEKAS